MLDVLHYFFEEDMIPRWEQDAEIKSKVRSVLYRSMYSREYKYGTETSNRHSDWEFDTDSNIYDEPVDGTVKPYFPPSSPEELQSILDAPLGE